MIQIPAESTSVLWGRLTWSVSQLEQTTKVTFPLHAKGAPLCPGLYRISWLASDSWMAAAKKYTVKGTSKIEDLEISFANVGLPCVLTVGRTTNIYTRLRQHFGVNKNNNRMLQRLRQLLPNQSDGDIRLMAITSLKVEWVAIASWVERAVLESYAKALLRPILDMDAEH